jgi:SAM-dependent methyltransferase
MNISNPTYQIINTLMKKYNGNMIVDNGCDNNEFKELFNKKIIGIEINRDAKADLYTNGVLPFQNNTVDLFLSNFVLEHADDQKQYLSEMNRCLKKGGKIILSVPRPLWYLSYYISPYTYWLMIKNYKDFMTNPNKYFVHGRAHETDLLSEISSWKESVYEKLFKQSKFKVVEKIRSCNFLSLDSNYAKLFNSINMPDSLLVHVTYVLEKK